MGLMTSWLVLIIASSFETPAVLICRCALLGGPHLKPLWLFLHGVIGVAIAILDVALYGWAMWSWPMQLLYGVWTLWRWWKHTKNNRRKLRDRALAKVRELGGRLVVEPVPVP